MTEFLFTASEKEQDVVAAAAWIYTATWQSVIITGIVTYQNQDVKYVRPINRALITY